MLTSSRLAPFARAALPVLALSLAAALSGCSATSSPVRAPSGAAGDPTRVEVWEQSEPSHAFVPTGDLWARSMSKPATLEKLREEAARFYMDGIYGLECKGPLHGECTATGFVYETTHAVGNAAAPVAAAAVAPPSSGFVYDRAPEEEPAFVERRAGDRVVASR